MSAQSDFPSKFDLPSKNESAPPESTAPVHILSQSWASLHRECVELCNGLGGLSATTLANEIHAVTGILDVISSFEQSCRTDINIFKVLTCLGNYASDLRAKRFDLTKNMLRKFQRDMERTMYAMAPEPGHGRDTTEHDDATELPAQQRSLPLRSTSERGSLVSGTNPSSIPLHQTQSLASLTRRHRRQRSLPPATSPKRRKLADRSFQD